MMASSVEISRDCDFDAGAGCLSAGITMDERIRNLMRERGHQDLADDGGRSGAGRGSSLGGFGEAEHARVRRLRAGIARTVVQDWNG